MNARARIHAMFPLDETAEAELDTRLDAYREEAIHKAIGRLRAIPVTCTALTGPVWYGDGWRDAIRALEDIADYQTPDDEAYPGELQRLRALALGLRVAALRKEDLAEAQRLLIAHAEHEIEAREHDATVKARQTALLIAIGNAPHGRWKSGRAVTVLRELGYHPVSPGTAGRDLAALAARGHLVRHNDPGCTWYEPTEVTP